MTNAADHDLPYLSPAVSCLAAAFARPKLIAMLCIVALAGTGWFYLGLQASGVLDVLCRALPDGGQTGATKIAIVATMWGAMTLAMMLPSAAPMILTYAEIADTAARKAELVVSPFVITAGFTVVWLGFAFVVTLVQLTFMRAALIDADLVSASGLFSGAIFIVAGVYQFSALKHACLRQCQHPFPFFFANWKTTSSGVFQLGVRQGLYCLGCCWAMMLVMFAVGVMNVVWMAALGIVMAIEKIGIGKRFSHGIGVLLIGIGVAFVLTTVVPHWPDHRI
jgi:predicted metal-binding membrane protein